MNFIEDLFLSVGKRVLIALAVIAVVSKLALHAATAQAADLGASELHLPQATAQAEKSRHPRIERFVRRIAQNYHLNLNTRVDVVPNKP